jgi:3D (Asp-Asp-Asp) domain-containing protein
MKSTAIGSAVSVLLVFSAISYAKNYVHQDPKPVPPTQQKVQSLDQQGGSQQANPESNLSEPAVAEATSSPVVKQTSASVRKDDFEAAPQTYTATAYSLRGRTASGRPVSRGLIAADPSVLPLGTRVRVEAGAFSGEYVVGDTGGSVRGRRIDIWTPTSREALQFGRRAVKLTVLSFGGRRAKGNAARRRQVNVAAASLPVTQSTDKREK